MYPLNATILLALFPLTFFWGCGGTASEDPSGRNADEPSEGSGGGANDPEECGDNLVPGVEATLVGAGEPNGCAGSVEGEQDGEVIPLSCVPDPDAMQDCICRGLGQGDWSVTATFGDAVETANVNVTLDACSKPVTQQLTFFE